MLSHKKKSFEKYLNPIIVYLSTIHPNILTLIGLLPSILFFVFLINHLYLPALIIYLANTLDFLDGMVARKYNKVTLFGGFLDSTVDRVSDFIIITAFAFANIVRWEIVAPLLLASFLISYTRARGEMTANKKISFAVGIIERTERLGGIFFSLVLYALFPSMVSARLNIAEICFLLLLAFSLITVFQRLFQAYKHL